MRSLRHVSDELLSPIIGEALPFCSSLSACSASLSSCLRSAMRLAFAEESFATAALSAHFLADCRRCFERALITESPRTACNDHFTGGRHTDGAGRSQSAH